MLKLASSTNLNTSAARPPALGKLTSTELAAVMETPPVKFEPTERPPEPATVTTTFPNPPDALLPAVLIRAVMLIW